MWSGTGYLSSRHLVEIAEPMQRHSASLQPSGSVSKNDRCRSRNRHRHRQERTATQQIVITSDGTTGSWLPFGPAQGIDWYSKQARRTQTAISTHVGLCHHSAPFFFSPSFFSTPRSHGLNPNPSQHPTLWSLSSRTPPTSQDGQATAWFARRLFCWFVRCHCLFPFEVSDSTRPDLDSTSTFNFDLFGSVPGPDLTWPEPDPTRFPAIDFWVSRHGQFSFMQLQNRKQDTTQPRHKPATR